MASWGWGQGGGWPAQQEGFWGAQGGGWAQGVQDWFRTLADPQQQPAEAYAAQPHTPPTNGDPAGYPATPEKSSGGTAASRTASANRKPAAPKPLDEAEVRAVVSEVKALGRENLEKAWAAFKKEYDCMLQIWNDREAAVSAAAKQTGAKPPEENQSLKRRRLRDEIDRMLSAAASDPLNAAHSMRTMLEESRGKDELNKVVVEKAEEVIKVDRHAHLCDRLAQACQESGVVVFRGGQPAAPADAQQKELEQLLKGCKLGLKLDSRARKVLGMPPSKEELAERERAKKTAQEQAYRAKVKQVSEASGVNRERAKQALDSTNGDAETATMILVSEEEANKQRKAETAAKKRQEAKDAAQALQMGRTAEAADVAIQMSELARSTQGLAWAKVREEFNVQVTLWETQASLGANRPYGRISREMNGVLDNAQRDPAGSVTLLEMVIAKGYENGYNFSNGVLVAADRVLDAERLARDRYTLSERLKTIARSMETKTDLPMAYLFAKQELTRLVQMCDIEDHPLGPRVHEVLRWGAPQMRQESI